MGLAEPMEQVARGVEVVGIATLVLGLVVALIQASRVLIGGRDAEDAYRVVRTVFGRSILLGLEFLVAADIIRTVAVEPSLENVGVLGLIVLIRTFLSFSLEVEIDQALEQRVAVDDEDCRTITSWDTRSTIGGPEPQEHKR
jgi:uncharacterized membrane protein